MKTVTGTAFDALAARMATPSTNSKRKRWLVSMKNDSLAEGFDQWVQEGFATADVKTGSGPVSSFHGNFADADD
tara:strand:+ start:103530 stop:103751 length:222 start_codon:yes stop_codon:yes gene_type:complete